MLDKQYNMKKIIYTPQYENINDLMFNGQINYKGDTGRVILLTRLWFSSSHIFTNKTQNYQCNSLKETT